ncbi:hypothetical protein IV102_08890 [bacterium]|nr:hypothetical protein [bacterium]
MKITNLNSFPVASGHHSLATKANTPQEDQLQEVFELWVRNNVGEQEFNVGKTHPEAFETAMTMIEAASQEVFPGEEGAIALPGSVLANEGEGRFAVGLHELSFQAQPGIVGQQPLAVLFVDTTPGQDGTRFSIGVRR